MAHSIMMGQAKHVSPQSEADLSCLFKKVCCLPVSWPADTFYWKFDVVVCFSIAPAKILRRTLSATMDQDQVLRDDLHQSMNDLHTNNGILRYSVPMVYSRP